MAAASAVLILLIVQAVAGQADVTEEVEYTNTGVSIKPPCLGDFTLPNKQCVFFNVPHILCAPNISECSIFPYQEYVTVPKLVNYLAEDFKKKNKKNYSCHTQHPSTPKEPQIPYPHHKKPDKPYPPYQKPHIPYPNEPCTPYTQGHKPHIPCPSTHKSHSPHPPGHIPYPPHNEPGHKPHLPHPRGQGVPPDQQPCPYVKEYDDYETQIGSPVEIYNPDSFCDVQKDVKYGSHYNGPHKGKLPEGLDFYQRPDAKTPTVYDVFKQEYLGPLVTGYFQGQPPPGAFVDPFIAPSNGPPLYNPGYNGPYDVDLIPAYELPIDAVYPSSSCGPKPFYVNPRYLDGYCSTYSPIYDRKDVPWPSLHGKDYYIFEDSDELDFCERCGRPQKECTCLHPPVSHHHSHHKHKKSGSKLKISTTLVPADVDSQPSYSGQDERGIAPKKHSFGSTAHETIEFDNGKTSFETEAKVKKEGGDAEGDV